MTFYDWDQHPTQVLAHTSHVLYHWATQPSSPIFDFKGAEAFNLQRSCLLFMLFWPSFSLLTVKEPIGSACFPMWLLLEKLLSSNAKLPWLTDFLSCLQVSQAGSLHPCISPVHSLVPEILNECLLKKWNSLCSKGKIDWCWHKENSKDWNLWCWSLFIPTVLLRSYPSFLIHTNFYQVAETSLEWKLLHRTAARVSSVKSAQPNSPMSHPEIKIITSTTHSNIPL